MSRLVRIAPRPTGQITCLHSAAREDVNTTTPQLKQFSAHHSFYLASALTVFAWRDRHVPSLQLLYDSPYIVLWQSLHHCTLQIGDKMDKVFHTLAEALQQPHSRRFRNFPPPGVTHDSLQGTFDPASRRGTALGKISPGHPLGGLPVPLLFPGTK